MISRLPVTKIVNCKAERLVYGGALGSGGGLEVVDRPVEDDLGLLFKEDAGGKRTLVPLNRSYRRCGGC